MRCIQNEGDVVHKVFDSEEDQKGGHLPFLPTVRRNFGNFCFMFQKEILIICKTRRKLLCHFISKIPLWYNMNTFFFSKFPPTTGCAVGIRTRRVRFLLTVEEGKTEVEVFHQICVSHHHVKHISGSGLNVTANNHILSIRKHYSDFSLRRTRTSFSGLCWVHTNKHTHMDTKNTFTCRYTIQTVYVQHHIT